MTSNARELATVAEADLTRSNVTGMKMYQFKTRTARAAGEGISFKKHLVEIKDTICAHTKNVNSKITFNRDRSKFTTER